MNEQKRVEIIANRSVEEDIMEALAEINMDKYFTKINNVHGRGNSNPKQGDHIWPEENFILIIYCSPENASEIKKITDSVRERFPDEGIRCFITG